MLIISLATASTVLTLNTYKKGDDGVPVPLIMQKIFFDVIAKILFIKVKYNRNMRLSFDDAFFVRYNQYDTFLEKINTHNFREKEMAKLSFMEESPKNKSCFKMSSNDHIIIENNNSNGTFKNRDNTGFANKLLLKASPLLQQKNKITNIYDPNICFENLSNNSSLSSSKINMVDQINDLLTTTPKLILRSAESVDRKNPSTNRYLLEQKKLTKLIRSLNIKLEKNDTKEIMQKYKDEIKNQWTQLAKIFDMLLGYAFVLTSFFLLVYMLIKTPNVRFT